MTETSVTPDNIVSAAAALGVVLRQTREQKGWSVGEVAECLKLSARQVEALESGVYQGLPEPVFVKGFLYSYARLLELDDTAVRESVQIIFPQAVVEAAQPVLAKPTGLDYRDVKVRKPIPKWVFGLVILATIGTAIYAWQSKSSAENARQTESASQVTAGQVALPNVEANNVTVVSMSSSEAAVAASVPASAPMASTPVAGASEPFAVGAQTLVVTVRYRSLLQVTDAKGEVLISQIVPAGSEHRFDNGAPYQLKIGYALGATVSLGGVEVPLVGHIRNKTANFTAGSAHE